MTALEAIGLLLLIYMALSGLAGHIYFAWSGIQRTRQHLDLGRLNEDAAVRDSIAAPSIDDLTPGQRSRLAIR